MPEKKGVLKKNHADGDFSGGLVVQILPPTARGAGLIPGRGAKTPHASQLKNQEQYCNKFNKDFKNGPHQKILKKYFKKSH